MWRVAVGSTLTSRVVFYLAFVDHRGRTTKALYEDFRDFDSAQKKADRLNG